MLFSQLLLAHLLGDFLLQPRRALVHKQTHRAGSWFLYVHALIHFVLTLLLVWDLHFWKLAGIIAITHLLIDLAKLYARSWFANDRIPFILDQLAHLAVLFAVATYPETAATVTGALANADWVLLAGLSSSLPSLPPSSMRNSWKASRTRSSWITPPCPVPG